MGFRSYIREFLVAILMLFRPSGPCCLGVVEALFLSLESSVAKIILLVFSHSGAVFWTEVVARAGAEVSIREFLVAILMLFRPFGRNFDAFPSFTAMVFSHPGALFWTEGVAKAGAAAAAGGKSIAKIILFYGFQKLH